MKTIAEKIQKMTEQEKVTYERYRGSLLREVNALCKRLGLADVTDTDVTLACKQELPKDTTTLYGFQINPLVAIVAVVEKMSYISALRDKWLKIYRELNEIKLALQ